MYPSTFSRFSIRQAFSLTLFVGLASCGGSDTPVITDATVPNVVGETQAAATFDIGVTGLKVGAVTSATSTSVPSGNVISQSPTSGAAENLGTLINLVISTGPQAVGSFAYVPDGGASTLSAYALNSTTGVLTALAVSPISVPGSGKLFEAKIDPSGQFLYVTDDSSPGQVFAFSIDQSTGAVTAVTGSPFPAGNGSRSLAFDATGAYLYVANNADGTISAFALNTSSGVLTALTNSPFTITGTNPQPSQLARAGNFLYVADTGTVSVQAFAIMAGTGALTQGAAGSPYATAGAPMSIAVDPAGTVLYTANSDQTVSGFTVDASTGVLTPITGSQIAAAHDISIDPQGQFLFVTETNGVSVYPIAGGGVLAGAAAGSPFVAGTTPYSVGFDPTGQYAYVGNDGSGNVSEFSIEISTGVLSPLTGSPLAAGANPDFVVAN